MIGRFFSRKTPPRAGGGKVVQGLDELVEHTSGVVRRWAETPYYDAVEKNALTQWTGIIEPYLKGEKVSFKSVCEIAVGHGRMTDILLQRSDKVIGVDPLQENIDFCAERFAGNPKLTLIRNDGVTLKEIDSGSVTFLFCWDSMVHFDSDVVRHYLREAARVLVPGGYFFTHHSNRDAGPCDDFQKAPHARNFMTVPLFQHYACKEGLIPVRHEAIDWGRGEKFFEKLDGLALVQKPR